MRLFSALVAILIACVATPNRTSAWEANYPSGPVRTTHQHGQQQGQQQQPQSPHQIKIHFAVNPKKTDLQLIRKGKKKLKDETESQEPDDGSLSAIFRRRTVAYPAPDGVALGHAWDFLSNEKKFLTCVQFTEKDDTKYQTVESRLQQTIDDETLDISLNVKYSASAGGSIGEIAATGEATSTFNASHHMSSNDTVFIVHESATNGVIYAAPNQDGLKLLPNLAKLAATDPETFREKCGDGFVASIGLGADLYVKLHAHDLTTEDKVDFEFASKASAGVAGVFNAGGSTSLSAKIDDLIKKKSLDLEFIQQGGIFQTVPTSLEEARKKVQSFMGEEKMGPRSIFITLVPYSELPNWPGNYLLDTSNLRQRAIRYSQRLASVLYEIMNIRENYFREDGLKGDRYLFDYAHQLRKEDLNKTTDAVRDELKEVQSLLQILDGPDCKAGPVSSDALTGKLRSDRLNKLRNLGDTQQKCESEISTPLSNMRDFDDFRFWITLPLPLAGVPAKDLSILIDTGNADDKRKKLFEQDLFRYWVERIDQIRCRLFFECLSNDDRQMEYDTIVGSVNNNPPPKYDVATTTKLICYGENTSDTINRNACSTANGRIHYGCDQANFEVDATQLCEVGMDSFRHSVTTYNSRGGNACGYTDGTVICYNYYPKFPNGE